MAEKSRPFGDPIRPLTTARGDDCPYRRIVERVIDVGQAIRIKASKIPEPVENVAA